MTTAAQREADTLPAEQGTPATELTPPAASFRGTTTVSERAVRRIAERATAEALPGRTAKATATVRGGRAEVSLGVTLPIRPRWPRARGTSSAMWWTAQGS